MKRKQIPYNSENKPRGLYFSKALFERLIFGGAYVRWESCVTKLIGLAYSWKANKKKLCYRTVFALFYIVFEGNFKE